MIGAYTHRSAQLLALENEWLQALLYGDEILVKFFLHDEQKNVRNQSNTNGQREKVQLSLHQKKLSLQQATCNVHARAF